MAGALTLIIFVAAGDAEDVASRAMLRAARTALGGQSHVEIRARSEASNDAHTLLVERQALADAVADVSWRDAAHRQARLHLHIARTDRWVDRSIGFQPSDVEAERGRTIGFALASMLPEAMETPPTAAPVAPAPTPAPAPAPATAPAPPPAPSDSATPSAAARPPDRLPVGSHIYAPERFLVDVAGAGAIGKDASVDALGAVGAVQWFPILPLAVRLAGGARAGSIPTAQATTLTAFGTAGLVFSPLRATEAHTVGFWVRVDYVLEYTSMSHLGADPAAATTQGRLMSGVDAVAGIDWMFAPKVGLIAGVGGEDVFFNGYVDVGGVRRATLLPLRALAEVGFRVRF
jgi:hypothetical protein